jgi:hypothetical protein
MLTTKLLTIYIPLLVWTGTGWLCGRFLPPKTAGYLGKFLFWVGVPIGIIAFLRHAKISAALWIAPVTAWVAIFLGVGLAWWWMSRQRPPAQPKSQASFLLTSMVGNTGYIGFPVSLALVGPEYFAWALFYDMLGSTPGAYGLGVALAARLGSNGHTEMNWRQPLRAMVVNPTLWSFGIGLTVRDIPLPPLAETSLHTAAWFIVSLSLVLVGMRLSTLSSLCKVQPAAISLGIKMVLVPLVISSGLWLLGVNGLVHRAILLQMAMPPAFATLVISEAYELDQEMTVTAIAVGCLGLLIMLPIWLWLFQSDAIA